MPAPVCQHDPKKENSSVSPIDQNQSYMILYCSICKKTEVYREPRAAKTSSVPPPVRKLKSKSPEKRHHSPLNTTSSSPKDRRRMSTPSPVQEDSSDSDSSSGDSDSDLQEAKSSISEIYAKLEAIRRKSAKADVTSPAPSSTLASKPTAPALERIRHSSGDIRKAMSPSAGSSMDLRPKQVLISKAVRDSPRSQHDSPRDMAVVRGERGRASSPRINCPRQSSPCPLPAKGPATPLSAPGPIPKIGSLEDSEKVTLMKYDVKTQKWSHSEAQLVIADTPFQEGNLRSAFHCVDVTVPNTPKHFVCKMSKDPKEDVKTYFVDVEMQCLAQKIAEEFNKRNPPKKVYFVDAFLIKCLQRKGQPILAVEPYLHGKYVKHTNNFGFVSKEDRNTPQAFSHFSYCYTQGQTLVCDIQGVDDYYTDPQIHSRDGNGWGHGNLGPKGMMKFFETHHCNAICRYLRLPPNNPKQEDTGTVCTKDLKRNSAQLPPKVA